jgi:hypothetical protein
MSGADRFLPVTTMIRPSVRGGVQRAAAIATDHAIVVSDGRARAGSCVRVPLTDDTSADRLALRDARRALVPAATGAVDLDCALLTRQLNIFPLTLVGEAAKARDTAVVAQVRSRLAYPLAEAVIDYDALPPSVKRAGDDGVNVLVYAVHRPLVDSILDRLGGAGWNVSRLLTPGAGLAPLGEAEGRRLLVASTRSALALSVIENHNVLMERVMPWGIDRLVDLVAERLDLPADVARRLLRGDFGEVDLSATPRAVREILGRSYREIVREAIACLGYCSSTLKPVRTTEFWLVGSIAEAPGFAEVLQTETGAERTHTWDAAPANELSERADALRLVFEEEGSVT